MIKIRARVLNRKNAHTVTLRGAVSDQVRMALATCCCNDIYREAQRQGMVVRRVHATVEAPEGDILERHTDRVAEIQNSLRQETPATLGKMKAVSGRSRQNILNPRQAAQTSACRPATRRANHRGSPLHLYR